MKKRKIAVLTLIAMLCCTGLVFAENWYIINTYTMEYNGQKDFFVRTVVRVYDKETCYALGETDMPVITGMQCVNTMCVTGVEYDTALKDVFQKYPTNEIYIALIDKYGYEMVVDFLKVPPGTLTAFAEDLADKLKAEGGEWIEIVCPKRAGADESEDLNVAVLESDKDEIFIEEDKTVFLTKDETEKFKVEKISLEEKVNYEPGVVPVFNYAESKPSSETVTIAQISLQQILPENDDIKGITFSQAQQGYCDAQEPEIDLIETIPEAFSVPEIDIRDEPKTEEVIFEDKVLSEDVPDEVGSQKEKIYKNDFEKDEDIWNIDLNECSLKKDRCQRIIVASEGKKKESIKSETKRNNVFSLGETKQKVKQIQGKPDKIMGNIWFYGSDVVVFDKKGKVVDYSNFSQKLRIK
ncbi:MAG: hypothetical protein ABH869_04655 [Candidatus Omnitrophota bacterium]